VRERLASIFNHYKTFLPRRELEIRKAGRVSRQIQPLFGGYFFLSSRGQLIISEALELVKKVNQTLSDKGVVRVLGMGGGKLPSGGDALIPIPQGEIEQIRMLADERDLVGFSTFVNQGDTMVITSGPLKGREAIIKQVNKRKKRVRVSLELMGTVREIDLGLSALT